MPEPTSEPQTGVQPDASSLETPVLLLAMPQVQDPHFFRSVVLLLRHEDEGSFGFIVNRPLKTPLSEILENLEIPAWEGDPEATAHFGGPVQPQLGSVLFVPDEEGHLQGEGTSEVVSGLALTHHIGDLGRLAAEPPHRLRLLLGYAAWGDGQLMEEIVRNDWLVAPADPDLIFAAAPDTVWGEALRSVGVDPASLPSWVADLGDGEAN